MRKQKIIKQKIKVLRKLLNKRVLNRIDSYLNELYDDLLKKSKYKQNYLYGCLMMMFITSLLR